MFEIFTLKPEIDVGSLVLIRTSNMGYRFAVVRVGKYWPNKGKLKIVSRREDGRIWKSHWVYPSEVELVENVIKRSK